MNIFEQGQHRSITDKHGWCSLVRFSNVFEIQMQDLSTFDLAIGFFVEFHSWGQIPRSRILHPAQNTGNVYVLTCLVFHSSWGRTLSCFGEDGWECQAEHGTQVRHILFQYDSRKRTMLNTAEAFLPAYKPIYLYTTNRCKRIRVPSNARSSTEHFRDFTIGNLHRLLLNGSPIFVRCLD